MTIKQFLKKLSRTKRWWIFYGDNIRAYRGSYASGWFCPITGVCKAELGLRLKTNEFRYGGQKLRLSLDDIRAIMKAADKWQDYDPELRARLLKACGLEEAMAGVAEMD